MIEIDMINTKDEIIHNQAKEITELQEKIDVLNAVSEQDNKTIANVLDLLDWFNYHNKNLTKEQLYKIGEIYNCIYQQN